MAASKQFFHTITFPTFWPILFRTQTPERRFEHLSYSYRDLMGSAPSCRCGGGGGGGGGGRGPVSQHARVEFFGERERDS